MTIDANGFDRDYYLRANPDVAAAGLDAYQHYLTYGWREGRDPNQIFDVRYYLATNPDVAAAGLEPLGHYAAYGWREWRDPSRAFDTSDYLNANRDVAAARLNPLFHYLAYGEGERRAITTDVRGQLAEGFDAAWYRAANPDVAAAGTDAYLHYQIYGDAEGRAPNALFDKAFYLARNPDVAAAGLDPFQHFLDHGWREGRDPSALFSVAEYNAAIGSASGNPLVRYLTTDRYTSLPSDLVGPNPPQIIQSRGQPLSAILVGNATFAIDGALTRVAATASPLDGHDLSGFTFYSLGQSAADITITGTGRLPTLIALGAGDDRLAGAFDLGGRILNLSAGGGTLSIDARIDNGVAAITGGAAGSTITLTGSATVSFTGGGGADVVTLGAANDSLSGGNGINRLDGGAGIDSASWATAVRADLSIGQAVSTGAGFFRDTLISIENIHGSPFDDILLGDDRANTIRSVGFSPSLGGNDILAGRGGDDTLLGSEGNDILLGGRGADVLSGGAGNDLLVDAADPWGVNNFSPQSLGNDGDDWLVYLLGARGEEGRGTFMSGGAGADTFIVDTSQGRWGSLGLEFSQIDGDRIDLSALRTFWNGAVTLDYVRQYAYAEFSGSTTIALGAFRDAAGNELEGRIVMNGVFAPADLRAADFIFTDGVDWRAAIPADLLPLI